MSARPRSWVAWCASLNSHKSNDSKQQTRECHTRGCKNDSAWGDRYCHRCREELDDLGMSAIYPRWREGDEP